MSLITIAEVKAQMKLSTNVEDALITICANQAIAMVNSYLGYDPEDNEVTATFTWRGSPSGMLFSLGQRPNVSLTSVTLNGGAIVAATDASNEGYYYDTVTRNLSLVGCTYQTYNSLVVVYDCGWATASIPADLKGAAIMQAIEQYQRGFRAGVRTETKAGGATMTYMVDELLPQVRFVLDLYRRRF
jgi:hypothetical protein